MLSNFNKVFNTLCMLMLLFSVPDLIAQMDRANFITHGPVLGRIDSDGIGIWGRTAYSGEMAVRYGLDKDKLDQISPSVLTTLEHDNTGWVKLSELKPNTKYYYELFIPETDLRTGRDGSFTTLPDARDFLDPELNPGGLFNFSFEFGCGNNQNPTQSLGPAFPASKIMLEKLKDKIHFAIQNGDWLYEARRDYHPKQWLAQVNQPVQNLPKVLEHAPTLVGVWENYKLYYDQSENLSNWHRNIPSFFTYDDHELLNDIWGTATPGLRDRRAVFRDIGVQGWYDYLGWSNPLAFKQDIIFGSTQLKKNSGLLLDPDSDFSTLNLKEATNLHVHWGTETAGVNDNALDGVGGKKNAGVYQIVKIINEHTLQIDPPAKANEFNSYSIGRRSYFHKRISNCDFFVLDTRGQRQMHDTSDPFKKGLSILGNEQREWLLENTSKSDADFIFVISSVNFMLPHIGGAKIRTSNKDDAWTVFFDEREKLINAWDKLNQPVFVLTGDLHNSFAIKITDNVWEFASGPHNSMNHWISDEGDRPANGKFKYGPREVDIRWSTFFRTDIPRENLLHPFFCVVQINNVFNNPIHLDDERWVAFPRPQAVFQYYDGISGDLRYAEAVQSGESVSFTEN